MQHYFSRKQQSNAKERKILVRYQGAAYEFFTASGMFSVEHLDTGSEVLITYCKIKGKENVLDLGCGWGAIGILLKKRYPSVEITFSEINERAAKMARKNCERHQVDATVYCSDGFERIKENFDVVLLNPPISAGRELCFRLISESYAHIAPGGNMQIVARTQKGGRMLASFMEKTFGNVAVLKKKSGFGVYFSKKD